MPKLDRLIREVQKKHGEETVFRAKVQRRVARLPTGIFPFDLASGGGMPRGKINTLFGPESCGKTNLALKTVASAQKVFPTKTAVFIDVEHSFDPHWSRAMGVDVDKLYVMQPAFGEDAVDMTEGVIGADDVSIVVVDSIAALTPKKEVDNDASKQLVAGNALLITKMCRKLIVGLSQASKRRVFPTVILINQVRYKVGLMYGNPETMPGGQALKHASSLIARVYGKNKVEKTINPVLPAFKETQVLMTKWKFPIVQANCEYDMAMIDDPESGLAAGYVDSWNTLAAYMKEYHIMHRHGTSFVIDGNDVGTLTRAKKWLMSNDQRRQRIEKKIIDRAMKIKLGGHNA